MATIIARRLKDGSRSYRATIRIMRGNAVLHQETRSFRAKSLAVQWAREREGTLKRHGTGEKAVAALPLADGISITSLIDRYVKEFSNIQRWGRTKEHHLRLLQRLVGEWDASTLTTDQLVEHVRQRRLSGTGPSTCNNDLIWIRTVLKTARAAWGLPVNLQAVEDASHACRHLKLTAKSRSRSRRPTEAETQKLAAWFGRGDGRRQIPMHEIMAFAIVSARRMDEICRLRWDDIDRDAMTIVIRDMKDPEHTIGNDVAVKLTQEALAIINRQPRTGPLIFPYTSKSVSAAFTRACHMLGIKDLRFHDLRHEATCRLFEAGYQIHEVAHFTGHRSWATLKRYTNLKAADIKLRE